MRELAGATGAAECSVIRNRIDEDQLVEEIGRKSADLFREIVARD